MEKSKSNLYKFTSSRFPGSIVFSYRNGELERFQNYAMLNTQQLSWLRGHFPMFEHQLQEITGQHGHIDRMKDENNFDLMVRRKIELELKNENTTNTPAQG